jgi:hypothetical protein
MAAIRIAMRTCGIAQIDGLAVGTTDEMMMGSVIGPLSQSGERMV